MCGIVGMSLRDGVSTYGHDVDKIKNIFTSALVKAQIRGSAATGVVLMSRESKDSKPQAYVLRSPLSASDFVKTNEYKDLMNKVNQHALSIIGHTRAVSESAATAKNNINNHPFIHGSIIGVHNGRIMNDTALWNKHSGYLNPKSKCDSEILFALLNRKISVNQARSTEGAIEETLKEAHGWFALALVNAKEPEKVYLVRDTESPMALAWWPTPEVAMFASEYSYLTEAWDEHYNYAHSFKQMAIEPMQIMTLSSTVKGKNYSDLYASVRKIKDDKEARAKLIEENKEAFNITQGKS